MWSLDNLRHDLVKSIFGIICEIFTTPFWIGNLIYAEVCLPIRNISRGLAWKEVYFYLQYSLAFIYYHYWHLFMNINKHFYCFLKSKIFLYRDDLTKSQNPLFSQGEADSLKTFMSLYNTGLFSKIGLAFSNLLVSIYNFFFT